MRIRSERQRGVARVTRRSAAAIAAGLLACGGVVATASSGSTAPEWAPRASADITPGAQMYTDGAQCTANFVYTDSSGNVYVGYAAHCAGTGGSTDTDGCSTGSVPLGSTVDFTNDGNLLSEGTVVGHGSLAYSSWIAEHRLGTGDANTCAYNDLALVRIDAGDVSKVNPSVPFWGGPVGLSTDGAPAGSTVYSWGQSSLRPTTALSPKTGVSLGRTTGGWGWDVYTASPGVPGDSGSGFLDAEGRAFGTLSTVAIAPIPASNGLGDLGRELRYARTLSGLDGLRLVPGTEPFSPVP